MDWTCRILVFCHLCRNPKLKTNKIIKKIKSPSKMEKLFCVMFKIHCTFQVRIICCCWCCNCCCCNSFLFAPTTLWQSLHVDLIWSTQPKAVCSYDVLFGKRRNLSIGLLWRRKTFTLHALTSYVGICHILWHICGSCWGVWQH